MEFVEFYPVNKIFTAEMTFIVVLRKFRKTVDVYTSDIGLDLPAGESVGRL